MLPTHAITLINAQLCQADEGEESPSLNLHYQLNFTKRIMSMLDCYGNSNRCNDWFLHLHNLCIAVLRFNSENECLTVTVTIVNKSD